MTVLLTGVAGFIGSHLAERLLQRGDSVIGVDNFDPFYDRSIKESNLAAIRAADDSERFHFVEGAFVENTFTHAIRSCPRNETVVVHLAALAGVRPSLQRAADYTRVNVQDFASLMDQMVAVGHQKLVFASSSSVYGEHNQGPFDEAMRVDKPISPYAATKRAGEILTYTYHHLYAMRTLALRFFTVYGPRQRPDLAMSKFIDAALSGRAIEIYGDGSATRDFTFVEDTVSGVLAAIDWVSCEDTPAHDIVNLGAGEPVSLSTVIATVESATGVTLQKTFGPRQPGDVTLTHASIEKASRLLGYRPHIRLQEGIARQVAWFRGW